MSPLEGVEEAHTPLLFFICFLCVMAEQHQTVAKGRLHRENMILAGVLVFISCTALTKCQKLCSVKQQKFTF